MAVTWMMTIAVLSIAAYLAPVLGLALILAGVGPAQLPLFHRRVRAER